MIVDALLAATVLSAGLQVHDVKGVFGDLATYRMFGGEDVTADSAMQTTAVFACVRVKAETMGVLPFHVYEQGGPAWPGSKRMATHKVPTHRLRKVIQYEPNPWQTGLEFREMMEGHLTLRGNAYAVIVPGPEGAVGQLIPKHPDRMKVVRLENGRLGYLYRPEKSLKPERYTQDQIFHLRGLSFDGLTGLNPIALDRRAVELAQQGEDHGLKFFKNKAKPGGALKMREGQTLDDEEQHRRLRNSWQEAHSGDDLFSVAIMEDGMEWQQMGISNEDGQWLDSRRFQVPEICRIFRVPPHMVYAAIEHGHTYANVEWSDLAFVKHTMTPEVVRWEQAIRRDLMVDQDRYTVKFSMEGLLRGDSKARAAYAKTMVDMGAWNLNDVRELDEKNPFEGGEVHTIAAGRVPLTAEGVMLPVTGKAEVSEPVEALPIVLPEPIIALADYLTGQPPDGGNVWNGGEVVDGAAVPPAEDPEGPIAVGLANIEAKQEEILAKQGETSECLNGLKAGQEQGREERAAHDDRVSQAHEKQGENHTAGVEKLSATIRKNNNSVAEAEADARSKTQAWATDTARRIAIPENQQIRKRLSLAVSEPAEFAKWVRGYWTGKRRSCMAKAVASFLETCGSDVTPEQVVTTASEQAVATLASGDVAVLKSWEERRVKQITGLLMEAIRDDKRSE